MSAWGGQCANCTTGTATTAAMLGTRLRTPMPSTPRDCAFDDTVREMVNKRLGATSLVTAACVDSTCNDGVQLADLVAGAVAHQRGAANLTASPSSHKGKIAARLAAAFDVVSFASDIRNGRVNVATLGLPAAGRRTA